MSDGGDYREVFEKSPDAIVIMEGDRFVDCNPAAVRMLRFPSRQALLERYSGSGREGARRAHPADLSPRLQPDGRDSFEKAEEILAITFERGSHTFEWLHLCADGEPLLVEVQLTVVRRGERPVLHAVWRDISERKRLEAELRRAQRLEAVGRLAGGIAHDFNNLLVVILSHAELLQGEFESGQPDAAHVTEIQAAADRAASLTRQLLAFSRGQPARTEITDLGGLVEQLGGLLRPLIGEDIALDLKREEGPLNVLADSGQLEQVVVNLSTNARDAMPDGGSLEISVRRRELTARDAPPRASPGPYVSLQVRDSGTGMTGEQIDRAFDPFFTTKDPGKGTGLGLATVHAIVEQHDGHASISSAPGRGTTVEVLLPRSDREPAPVVPARGGARADGGGETILLVEDERAIRDLLERAMRDRGYEVLTAEDGQDALERVARFKEPIDLLVTDVVMPRMSGAELARRLAPLMPGMKVLYMSGYSRAGSLDIMTAEDRAAVFQKPFAPSVLLKEIRRILDREAGPSAPGGDAAPPD